ncbi:MAG TPA: LTA synthase family protein [Aromatoleum sp.]|uniref:LTA synthase family protein n=1 Tax=Aromatoleum sp. TaxID=2307007 RepID=UPI002B47B43C|nr:LTA synthase family protein [Aromatoleum sp.]HJV25202.1 LTA synthase family protein [Aromatoleum sp.]
MSTTDLQILSPLAAGWLVLLLISLTWYLDLCLLLTHRPIHGRWFIDQFIRELSFTFILTASVPAPVLIVFFLILFVFILFAHIYQRAFLSPLSFTTIRRQWTDGAAAVSLEFLNTIPDIFIRATALFMFKAVLLWASFAYFPVPYKVRLAPLCVVLPLFALKTIQAFNEVQRLTRGWASPIHLVPRYGYVLVWLNEFLYLHDDDLLREALEARELVQDRITPFEGPLSLPSHFVMLQVESLAYAVLNKKACDTEITPFLNRISKQSMLFKTQAIHMNGSCDADFTLLHAHRPGSRTATYRLPGYPHHDSLPHKCRSIGMPLSFLHGQKGAMFNRGEVFKTMEFEHLLFGEDMRRELAIAQTKMGGVPDHYVFDLAADLHLNSPGPRASLIVTVSSHTPFHDLPPDFRSDFLSTNTEQQDRYFHSLRYFDQALESFVQKLPNGTVFVIFGDHEPPGIAVCTDCAQSNGSFSPEGRTKDFVPAIVYRKGTDLAALQRTPSEIALSGELTMLDLATWIHAWFDPDREAQGPSISKAPAADNLEVLSTRSLEPTEE